MAKHLTQRELTTKKPGRYTDVCGLSLLVQRGGSRQWIWRGVIKSTGKEAAISLGSIDLYTIDEAREIAIRYKRLARQGIDPRAKASELAPTPTLADAIGKVIGIKRSEWKDAPKTEARWTRITNRYGGALMTRPVDAVGTGDIEAALLRIRDKHATMIELQRFLSAGFAWAVVHGHRADNPADLVKSQLPKAPKVEHMKALDYSGIADAIKTIQATGAHPATKLAIEFLALTATRSGEVRGATWAELDLPGRTWTIPAERMKAGREHRVPLSDRCIAILRAAEGFSANGLVFASASGKTLSHGTLNTLMRREHIPGTPHGLRSAFRTWAAQCTDFPREVCEDALAHVTGDVSERSYQRGDYLAKRRELMAEWAAFVTAENVLPMRRSA